MFIKEGKILLASFVIGAIIAVGFAAYTYTYAMRLQQDIAENVLRFHVRANSDCEADQNLKNFVRAEILQEFADVLTQSDDLDETRANIYEVLPTLREHAQNIIHDAGFEHEVTAEIANVFFPTQTYGNIAFPPGRYEALQIIIGDGDGENWWCLMFPPLCYVDMTATDESRDLLEDSVSEEGFRLLMHMEESPGLELVVRFRVVEWWQNLLAPNDANETDDDAPAPQFVHR
ncbi:MAG: stage II sporulation protein R [Defluviitaleaceae bacterium]|nr:stage II sporulation protein R [Defluviitaleaceae bacterium]